jgi:hypothetical protein
MTNVLGYAASCAVLGSFLMRTMVPLRLIAILSNLLFLAYGYIENIHPVVFLHLTLLPINIWRLINAENAAPAQPTPRLPALGAYLIERRYAFWIAIGLAAALASVLAIIVVTKPQLV